MLRNVANIDGIGEGLLKCLQLKVFELEEVGRFSLLQQIVCK